MPRIEYVAKRFAAGTLAIIEQANAIITEYGAKGFSLTLRQLYYQFVARGLVANKQREYKRLGGIISDARLAGLIDWLVIEDRTRNLQGNPHWSSPASIIRSCVHSYAIDKWQSKYQKHRVQVWIEKDALIGVIAGVCERNDVDYFSCRGYTSQSELWRAGQRLERYIDDGQEPIIIHLGDHDPSGIDMTRDIDDRVGLFSGGGVKVVRIALNMNQVEERSPPPNPAKADDSRYSNYVSQYGQDCWELDALDPEYIENIIQEAIDDHKDLEGWAKAEGDEENDQDRLRSLLNGLDE